MSAPDFSCYVLLPSGVSASNLDQQLSAFARKVQPADNKDNYVLQSLNDVHYDAAAGNYSNKTISHDLINVLWLIAAFILLIACVNFINLSTAQAVNRQKVGVKKGFGKQQVSTPQLQFIAETFNCSHCGCAGGRYHHTCFALRKQPVRTIAFVRPAKQSCHYCIPVKCYCCCNCACRLLSINRTVKFQSCACFKPQNCKYSEPAFP